MRATIRRKDEEFDDRLTEGVTMQAAGDYQRASYIYMDILSEESWRGMPGIKRRSLSCRDRYMKMVIIG